VKSIDQHDLHTRRSSGGTPVLSELQALLDALAAEGVSPPPDTAVAVELVLGTRKLAVQMPDIPGWLVGADLDALTPAGIMDRLRTELANTGLRTGGGSNFVFAVDVALIGRAVSAVAADLDRIITELRPAFDAAAIEVHDAAKTGLTSATTAEQVIDLGDEAVAAYRRLASPLATLTRLWKLRNRLLFYVGRELPERDLGEQRWLDRCAAAPVELTVTELTWQQAQVQRQASATTPDTTATHTDAVDTEHEILEEVPVA
jgi:hypothetical protein